MLELLKDRVTLIKPDGRQVEGLRAIVSADRVTTIDVSEPIEIGDTLQRILPNGATETYVVVDVHYRTGLEDVPSTYDVSVNRVAPNRPKLQGVQVFVSHSSADARLAELLVDLIRAALNLSAKAIRCTSVDGHRLPAGADTDEQLREEILSAPVFVGLISHASFASAYVLFELGARWGGRKTLMPILAPEFDRRQLRGPVAGLSPIVWERAQLCQLLENVAECLGMQCEPASSWQRALERALGRASEATSTDETPPRPPALLSREASAILEVLAQASVAGLSVAGLAQALRWKENKVTHHAQKLVDSGHVEEHLHVTCGAVYALTPAAREYLVARGIL